MDPIINNIDKEKHHSTAIASQQQFSQFFLILILFGLLVLFGLMIRYFLVTIIIAGVFCSLFYPTYKKVTKWTRGRRNLSAMIMIIFVLLILLLPVTMLVNIVAQQAISLYESVEPIVQQLLSATKEDWAVLASHPLISRLRLDAINWEQTLQESLKTIAAYAGKMINITSKGAFLLFTYTLMTLFIMFYFFRDGDMITSQIMSLLPMAEEYKAKLIDRFVAISRATVKGTLVLGCLQGMLGAITLLVFGFKAWAMWGLVMVILSILPFVGSYMVLLPAAIYEAIMGRYLNGVGIALMSIVVISNIDNLLRPRLVGRDAGMHDLMVFFSTLGGLYLFGIMGFIVGPVIAALMIALLDIYRVEFNHYIPGQKRQTPTL